MRMPAPTATHADLISEGESDGVQRMCPRCQRRYRQGKPLTCEECEEKLQRRETSEQTPAVDAGLERQINSVRGGGKPLPGSVRSFFEPRFGADFSDVRVHTSRQADAAARAVHAEAFTVGRDVAFRSGAYRPGTEAGKQLLAHELTHVVQQGAATASGNTAKPEYVRASHTSQSWGLVEIERKRIAPNVQRRKITKQVSEPAGGCGVCYDRPTPEGYIGSGIGPADVGNVAHRIIQEEFEIVYGISHPEFPIGDSRPDLLYVSGNTVQIGEIKPANVDGYANGEMEMETYLRIAREAMPDANVEPLDRPLPIESLFPNPNATGCPVQMLYVNPPVNGVYGYYCEPSFSEMLARPGCKCRGRRTRTQEAPETVPSYEMALEEIRQFIENALESGVSTAEEAERAARRFLRDNPWVEDYLIGAAVLIVVGTILEDIATMGVGLLDDPASFTIAAALVRVAQSASRVAPAAL
ncbi:MAG: DUF4157 domain-containing protein [Spirochaetes bacterium]|nr:DUF4157 domain-containing protein [Spirochaetota bacterium]